MLRLNGTKVHTRNIRITVSKESGFGQFPYRLLILRSKNNDAFALNLPSKKQSHLTVRSLTADITPLKRARVFCASEPKA